MDTAVFPFSGANVSHRGAETQRICERDSPRDTQLLVRNCAGVVLLCGRTLSVPDVSPPGEVIEPSCCAVATNFATAGILHLGQPSIAVLYEVSALVRLYTGTESVMSQSTTARYDFLCVPW